MRRTFKSIGPFRLALAVTDSWPLIWRDEEGKPVLLNVKQLVVPGYCGVKWAYELVLGPFVVILGKKEWKNKTKIK